MTYAFISSGMVEFGYKKQNKKQKWLGYLALAQAARVRFPVQQTRSDSGVVVSIVAFQAVDPGSIPGCRNHYCNTSSLLTGSTEGALKPHDTPKCASKCIVCALLALKEEWWGCAKWIKKWMNQCRRKEGKWQQSCMYAISLYVASSNHVGVSLSFVVCLVCGCDGNQKQLTMSCIRDSNPQSPV